MCLRCAEHAGQGFVSPRCAGRRYSRCANRYGERLWQCSTCRHQTSLISDTLFASTKLPLTRWFLAFYLLTQSKTNMAALELMRHLGVCYRLAPQTQGDASHDPTRGGTPAGRACVERRCVSGQGAQWQLNTCRLTTRSRRMGAPPLDSSVRHQNIGPRPGDRHVRFHKGSIHACRT